MNYYRKDDDCENENLRGLDMDDLFDNVYDMIDFFMLYKLNDKDKNNIELIDKLLLYACDDLNASPVEMVVLNKLIRKN